MAGHYGTPKDGIILGLAPTVRNRKPEWTVKYFQGVMELNYSRLELRAAQELTADQYEQEYECSFTAAVEGVFFKEMAEAKSAHSNPR